MASTYTRPNSPFVWIRYKDDGGRWKGKATGYLKANPGDRRQAELMADELTRQERLRKPSSNREALVEWVDQWLEFKYGGSEATLKIYKRYWRRWQRFFTESNISLPRQLGHPHIQQYVQWRKKGGVGRNTAIHELKLLGIIMHEAVLRGFASANPFVQMKLRKDDTKEKRPWSDEHFQIVAIAMDAQPHWMRCTFVLGKWQAARLRQIPKISDIILHGPGKNLIHYDRVKGGKKKRFTHPIDPRAVDAVKTLIAERLRENPDAVWLCDIPPRPSIEWRRFLDGLGLTDISHHGLRVTWITRACLNGVPLAKAKRFVNHGSTTVHEIYQRLSADDLDGVPEHVHLPQ